VTNLEGITDMSACSRCGTTDDRHSKKCYEAMALGWALGMEPRPVAQTSQIARDYTDARVVQLEADNRNLQSMVDHLDEERSQWAFEVDRLRQQLHNLTATAVTHLPDGYYDGLLNERRVSADRLADIAREVAFLNESDHLEVTVHDPLNATVRPLRDDDYSAEALDQDQLVAELMDAAREVGEQVRAPEPEPEPVPAPRAPEPEQEAPPEAEPAKVEAEQDDRPQWDDTIHSYPAAPNWPEVTRAALANHHWTTTQLGTAIGASSSLISGWTRGKWKPGPRFQGKLLELAGPDATAPRIERRSDTKPTTVLAEEAAREYVAAHLVPADGTRKSESGTVYQTYVTAPELLAGYEAWAKANGKPIIPANARIVGVAAGKSPHVKAKRQGPRHGTGKPMAYFGVKLLPAATAEPEAPAEPQPQLSKAEQARQQTEAMRKLLAAAKTETVEHVPSHATVLPPHPDELAIKLAQLKTYGIGGDNGVSRPVAQAALADLHPTGRDVWKWSAPVNPDQSVSDAELDSTAYQLLVKCMNGLPDEYGYDYKDDVLATAGFQHEDVDSALRNPDRVEIRPESWDKEKRYPILGFYRGDVCAILGMRIPAKPRVIAAYWQSLMLADTHRVGRVGGGGSKKQTGLPTRPTAAIERLRAKGAEIPDPGPDEKPVTVMYHGQDLGKISTDRKTSKATVQSAYQRMLRKIEAIDRREASKVPA
jgi:hypothetical protein